MSRSSRDLGATSNYIALNAVVVDSHKSCKYILAFVAT